MAAARRASTSAALRPRAARRARATAAGGANEPDLVDEVLPAGLDEQGRLDDEDAGTGGFLLAAQVFDGAAGEGPDDVGELAALGGVAEDDAAEAGAVDGAVGGDDGGAEGGDEGGVAVAAGGVDGVGDAVGVYDAGAAGGEEAGDLALAAGDAAGEADGEHGATLAPAWRSRTEGRGAVLVDGPSL